jgi:hypothetical protein
LTLKNEFASPSAIRYGLNWFVFFTSLRGYIMNFFAKLGGITTTTTTKETGNQSPAQKNDESSADFELFSPDSSGVFVYHVENLEITMSNGLKKLYTGQVKNDKNGQKIRHGKGLIFTKSSIFGKIIKTYEGEFEDNQYNGTGTLYYESGEVEYEGEFKNNNCRGQGTHYFQNGRINYIGKNEGRYRWHGEGVLYPYHSEFFKNFLTKDISEEEYQKIIPRCEVTYNNGKPTQGTWFSFYEAMKYTGSFNTKGKMIFPGTIYALDNDNNDKKEYTEFYKLKEHDVATCKIVYDEHSKDKKLTMQIKIKNNHPTCPSETEIWTPSKLPSHSQSLEITPSEYFGFDNLKKS